MRQGTALGRLVLIAVAGFALVCSAVATRTTRAGDDDKKDDQPQRIEYVRLPLYSVFHPDPQTEAKLERGLYIGGPKANNQDFRIPVEIPVGATILEVGVVGQTSNQLTVRLERADWTPVYAFGEASPKDAGAWTCFSIVEKGLCRKTAKPVPDDQNVPIAKREFEEQEFVVNVSLARSPNSSKEEKTLSVSQQKDKVTALWLKIGR
ncbi:MAG: hypothetical protein ACAI25_10185 [Planctomycetota bacterium]